MDRNPEGRLPSLDLLATPLVGNVDTVTVVSGTDEQRDAIVRMLAQELQRFGTQIRYLDIKAALESHINQQTDIGREAKLLFLDARKPLPDKISNMVFERGINNLMLKDAEVTPRPVWAVNGYPMTLEQEKKYRRTMASDRYIDRNDLVLAIQQHEVNPPFRGVEGNLILDFSHGPDGVRKQLLTLFKEPKT